MICVTIGRGRHKHMIAEHQQMVDLGAELVELRVDYIVRNPNVKRLIENRPGPTVVTCRRQKDGGKWTGEEEDRLTLLRSAIADQPASDAWNFAQSVASSVPAPAVAYVLDVCESNGNLRLLELNPFGGADLYACNADAIVRALSEAASAG